MKKKMNSEQIEYFKSIVFGNTRKQISNLFYEKYNIKLTENQVRYYCEKYNVNCGFDGKFKKGQTPYNKKKIGDEFVNKDGYTFIKVEEPNTWIHKQQYIYENRYGKLPKGFSVVFLDKDKTNFDIDNLKAIPNDIKLTAKNLKLFYNNKEMTKTGLLVAELINKTSRVKEN